MSIKSGSTSIASLYLGSTKIGAAYLGSTKIYESSPSPVDPYNPLNLPAYTVRVKFAPGYTPAAQTDVTRTLVDGTENIWDITKYNNSSTFSSLFVNEVNLLAVLGANTTGVQSMDKMFNGCSSLTSVPLFDTSSVTDTSSMFYGCSSLASVPLFDTSSVASINNMFRECSSLTTVPLFNTSNVTNMSGMFRDCTALTSVPLFNTPNVTYMSYTFANCSSLTTIPLFNTYYVTTMSSMFLNCTSVESGALALYTQASTQTYKPQWHTNTFQNCGSNTQTGAVELAQIPSSWGGTGA